MKIKNLALLLCTLFVLSCSKDEEQLPLLSTSDFISMVGVSESDLDAKMAGYKKYKLENNVIVYSVEGGTNLYTNKNREVFLSIEMTDGRSSEVNGLSQNYPILFFSDVKDDLIVLYPNVDFDDIRLQFGDNLVKFVSDGKAFSLSKSSSSSLFQVTLSNK